VTNKRPTEGEEANHEEAVPYERFTEVNTRMKNAEAELEKAKPLIDDYSRLVSTLQERGITAEKLDQITKVQQLLDNDPEAALKELLPIVEKLQGFVGNKLPQDLQAKVENGTMELADAKELAQLRAKLEFGAKRTEYEKKQSEQRQMAELRTGLDRAAKEWEATKQTSDPDYRPKKDPAGPDGKWEMTRDKYLAMANMRKSDGSFVNPIRTVQDMVALMDEAYKGVSLSLKPRAKPATRKSLSSNGSSTNGKSTSFEDAPTLQEAVSRYLSRR
jgi:hypothetical protein